MVWSPQAVILRRMPTSLAPSLVAVTSTADDSTGAARVRLNAAYVHALEQAGLVPLIVPPLTYPAGAVAELLGAVKGLVLTGGEDVSPAQYGAPAHPALGATNAARDATELAITSAARMMRLPTLAICRGVQLLNVALGGTLVQDLPSQRPGGVEHDQAGARSERTHPVTLDADSRLARALRATELAVNSIHHQALDTVATTLRVTGRAPDGVIEAVEADDAGWWAVGVQWHPEELTRGGEPWDRLLFEAFAERVRRG